MSSQPNQEDFQKIFSLVNELDCQILMHRDVHFGNRFEFMFEYYAKEGKGVVPDFDLERIQYLAALEKQTKQNLAALLLSGAQAEKVAKAKKVYQKLRDIYETSKPKTKHPQLIADLILSEEEQPTKEIAAISAEGETIVPALIDLLQNEEFYDSLFPGYGQAPMLAVTCLGNIGGKRALIALFEAIGHDEDFFSDDTILKALRAIGEPAKAFLMQVVKSHPINEDNEKAAIALIEFKDDPKVATACLELLKDPEVIQDLSLAPYLILACEGLSHPTEKKEFLALSQNPNFPKTLRDDIQSIARAW